MIWAVSTVTSAVTTRFCGGLSDKIGRKPLVVVGRIILCLVPFLYALTSINPTWHLILLAEFVSGLSVGLGWTVLRIVSLDMAPSDQKSAYSGAIMSVTGITSFVGSLGAGMVTQLLELQIGHIGALIFMLYVGALLRFFAGLGFLFIKETAPSKTQKIID